MADDALPTKISEVDRLKYLLAVETKNKLDSQAVALQAQSQQAQAQIQALYAELHNTYKLGPNDNVQLSTGEITRGPVDQVAKARKKKAKKPNDEKPVA